MKQDNRLTYLVIILVLLIVSIISVTVGLIVPAITAEPTVLHNLPQIVSSVKDGKGNAHVVTSQFSLEMERGVSINQTEVANGIHEVMKNIDYERLRTEGGTDYVRNEVRKYIKEKFGASVKVSVYIYDLATDLYIETAGRRRIGDVFGDSFPKE